MDNPTVFIRTTDIELATRLVRLLNEHGNQRLLAHRRGGAEAGAGVWPGRGDQGPEYPPELTGPRNTLSGWHRWDVVEASRQLPTSCSAPDQTPETPSSPPPR